jgi:predicted PurR-regulated permease PerM
VDTGERRSAGQLARQMGGALGTWAVGQLVIAAVETALLLVGLGLLRVPLWFVLAPLCGLLTLIPHFGAPIGMLLGLASALLGGLDAMHVLGVVGVYVAVFALEAYWLTPRVMGRRLGLRPLWVFLAVLTGGAMFGFIGLLLAVPVLAVVAVIYRFFNSPANPGSTSTPGGTTPSASGRA